MIARKANNVNVKQSQNFFLTGGYSRLRRFSTAFPFKISFFKNFDFASVSPLYERLRELQGVLFQKGPLANKSPKRAALGAGDCLFL
jgi:hypothetical protein